MENVIETFLSEASRANDYHLVLGYQWALNAAESTDINVLDALMIQKAKEN